MPYEWLFEKHSGTKQDVIEAIHILEKQLEAVPYNENLKQNFEIHRGIYLLKNVLLKLEKLG